MTASADMARYRAAHPEVVKRDTKLAKARRRALSQLADAHPAEFVVLIDAVCAEMGITAPGIGPAGRPPRGGQ